MAVIAKAAKYKTTVKEPGIPGVLKMVIPPRFIQLFFLFLPELLLG